MSAPLLNEAEVREIVLRHFGLSDITVSPLGSCQDANFKIKHNQDGKISKYVLKISSSVCTKSELILQNDVIFFLHKHEMCKSIIVPYPKECVHLNVNDKEKYIANVEVNGTVYFGRLLSYVEGCLLSDYAYFDSTVLFSFGEFVAKISKALSAYSPVVVDSNNNDSADRDLQWDMCKANETIPSIVNTTLNFCASQSDISDLASIQLKYEKLLNISLDCTGAIQIYAKHANVRKQVVHGDLAHYNVIATPCSSGSNVGRPVVTGVIDFGDAMRTWLVAELAVAILSGFACDEEYSNGKYAILHDACNTLLGFHSIYPLHKEEVLMLWPLIVQRCVVNIVSQESELLMIDPDNVYNKEGVANEWYMLSRMKKIPLSLGQRVLYDCVFSTSSINTTLLTTVSNAGNNLQETLPIVDISVTSPLLIHGGWLCGADHHSLIDSIVMSYKSKDIVSKPTGIIPAGNAQLFRSIIGNANPIYEPESISLLNKVLFLGEGLAQVFAPWAGDLFLCGYGGYILRSTCAAGYLYLHLDNITRTFADSKVFEFNGSPFYVCSVTAHAILGTVMKGDEYLPSHFGFQITFSETDHFTIGLPSYSTPSMFKHFDNHLLVKTGFAFEDIVDGLLNEKSEVNVQVLTGRQHRVATDQRLQALVSRQHSVAEVQEHYFKPSLAPNIERGYGAWLYDINGRRYLDMVNNVAVVGHCHPTVVQAANTQNQLLNTNSRFVYSKLGEYAEAVLSKIPSAIKKQDKLNCVLFVNSGSEATDLALRISRAVVNRRRTLSGQKREGVGYDVICLEGAYHGVTTASDEISTTLNDNPQSRENRPPWIHLCPMPNHVRGLYNNSNCSEENIGPNYGNHVTQKIEQLIEARTPPCCFIAEPLSGNAGGVCLPPNYLDQIYRDIRAVGGLCIADEVQVGYGRLGNHFWGFMEHLDRFSVNKEIPYIVPDIITMAKAAGNGHPLGYVITSKEIAREFGESSGSFFSSAGGGPVSCAIGSAVLAVLEKEALQENAKKVGAYIHEKLCALQARYPTIIGYIHGHGLYQGVEIIHTVHNVVTPGTDEAYIICARLLQMGIICHNTGDYSNVLKVKPPLCFSQENADYFVHSLELCIKGGW